MNRRRFNQIFTSGVATSVLPSPIRSIQKTNRIKKGDVVGLITPGSPIKEDQLIKAKINMEKLGLVPYHTDRVRLTKGYLAGPDSERIADIEHMNQNEKVSLIWAIRGGYGCTRILDYLPDQLIRKKHKTIIGYSDITALHCYYQKHLGISTIHGPVASSEFTPFTQNQMEHVLFGTTWPHIIKPFKAIDGTASEHEPFIVNSGIARGRLVGGNLSILSALCGTKHFPKMKNNLVFMEDVGEKPYRIDRMLTQLISGADLGQAAGIVLGVFSGCETDSPESSLTLRQMINDRIEPLGIPALYGFSFGHIDNQCSLPMGVEAEMNTQTGTIALLESPFN